MGLLWRFQMLNQIEKIKDRINPGRSQDCSNLTAILDVSMFDRVGISYRLLDHAYAEESSEW